MSQSRPFRMPRGLCDPAARAFIRPTTKAEVTVTLKPMPAHKDLKIRHYPVLKRGLRR